MKKEVRWEGSCKIQTDLQQQQEKRACDYQPDQRGSGEGPCPSASFNIDQLILRYSVNAEECIKCNVILYLRCNVIILIFPSKNLDAWRDEGRV